jgi:hypothetical protein
LLDDRPESGGALSRPRASALPSLLGGGPQFERYDIQTIPAQYDDGLIVRGPTYEFAWDHFNLCHRPDIDQRYLTAKHLVFFNT